MSQALVQMEMQEAGHLLRINQLSGFNPLAFPICARTPKRNNRHSGWIGHVPFAMGLVAMIKPRTFVELGTYWGVSYCAFCQAVKELRLDTRCYAVDTWEGDPHASFYGPEVLNDLKAHHDTPYSLFSELVRSTFAAAAERFPDGSVDLLHIDGFHSYEAVAHDFETWLPKMSERGIILFHDTEVRDRDEFGVWRFWDEIKQKYPHLEFHHSNGLGILAVGESIPEDLQPLLSAPEAEAARAREYFRNLGDHLTELFNVTLQGNNLQELLHATRDQLHAAHDQLQGTHDRLSVAHNQLHAKEAEVEHLKAQYGRIRFRVMDKVANRVKQFPMLHRAARSTARAAIALKRKAASLGPRTA